MGKNSFTFFSYAKNFLRIYIKYILMDEPVDIQRARLIWGTTMDEDTLKEWVEMQNLYARRSEPDDPNIPKGATVEWVRPGSPIPQWK
jgi:hypothetical protein